MRMGFKYLNNNLKCFFPSGLEHNFNKYDDDYITDQNTAYDYESIMHYRPFSFNKNDSIPTITTKIPEFVNIIGQYLDFSEMDTLRLNRMYNCCTYTLLTESFHRFLHLMTDIFQYY